MKDAVAVGMSTDRDALYFPHQLRPGQCSCQPRQALATTGVIFDCRQPGGPGGCRAASVRQLNITHVVAGAESILHDSPERSEVLFVRARSNPCPHVWPVSAERGAGGVNGALHSIKTGQAAGPTRSTQRPDVRLISSTSQSASFLEWKGAEWIS